MVKQPWLKLEKPLGSWVWNVSQYAVNSDEMFEFCRNNHVTELYFSINRDVTDLLYVDLIRRSAACGIRAAALSGDPIWIFPDRQSTYREYLERVDSINSLCGNGPKFYSIHLDVEPHVLPEAKRGGMEPYEPAF